MDFLPTHNVDPQITPLYRTQRLQGRKFRPRRPLSSLLTVRQKAPQPPDGRFPSRLQDSRRGNRGSFIASLAAWTAVRCPNPRSGTLGAHRPLRWAQEHSPLATGFRGAAWSPLAGSAPARLGCAGVRPRPHPGSAPPPPRTRPFPTMRPTCPAPSAPQPRRSWPRPHLLGVEGQRDPGGLSTQGKHIHTQRYTLN